MKFASLRSRIAISAGLLSATLIIGFAGFSSWRFYREQLDAFSDDQKHPLSGEHLTEVREETGELLGTYLITLPIATVLAACGAWWMAGQLSKPIAQLSESARRIDAKSLDIRLPEPQSADEIHSLATTLNHLLDRLERSFRQATRFSADASHELRTPLAIMRAELEQAIEKAPRAENVSFLVGLLEETQRLSSIVDKLLLLAEADAGRLMADAATVDFSSLLFEVADDFGILAEQRRIRAEGEINREIRIWGDSALLRRLAQNLFENALKYNVSGGWMRYRLERKEESAFFTISNSGPHIPAAAREQLFERFFRVDRARGRKEGGAGLGLSICREIARAHHGRIEFVESEPDGNAFLLILPLVSQRS